MPQKYRRIGDFHEYYSGARIAPYLTLFIGGNHEASNHLAELYYGGWVAPQIYYMGAANVLRLGPLRIAGLSGIWKGYDYRKTHFERLPYNESEKVSIFHVRELDVRKLLSIRTQVDVGLSHDWPQGVEWSGNYGWLFRTKNGFEVDANAGRLGSVAARQCLDWLRPAYWFSAHLHVKYTGMVHHGLDQPPVRQTNEQGSPDETLRASASASHHQVSNALGIENDQERFLAARQSHNQQKIDASAAEKGLNNKEWTSPRQESEVAQLRAWQNFQIDCREKDAQDVKRQSKAEDDYAGKSVLVGDRLPPPTFDETWKKVQVDENDRRGVASIVQSTRLPGGEAPSDNTESGSAFSGKRRRPPTPETSQNHIPVSSPILTGASATDFSIGTDGSAHQAKISVVKNADEIEIELSDSASENMDQSVDVSVPRLNPAATDFVPNTVSNKEISMGNEDGVHKRIKSGQLLTDDREEVGVINVDPSLDASLDLQCASVTEQTKSPSEVNGFGFQGRKADGNEVSEAMRAKLADLSRDFAYEPAPQAIPAKLPRPAAISNLKTCFLALDKCEKRRDFLQLLEIESISPGGWSDYQDRPFQFQYDPEWLAILRVFASELEFGGDVDTKVPRHQGDAHYREQVGREEQWIDEHVVQPQRLMVPKNFTITAPTYDPDEEVLVSDQPWECNNPQTQAFCDLIGIENKFNVSAEEREMRMASGPRPTGEKFSHRGRGRGRARGGGRGDGFHGHSRGRGRGRDGVRGAPQGYSSLGSQATAFW